MSYSTNFITQATFLNLSSKPNMKNFVKSLMETQIYSCTDSATLPFPSVLNINHFFSLRLRFSTCRLAKLIKINKWNNMCKMLYTMCKCKKQAFPHSSSLIKKRKLCLLTLQELVVCGFQLGVRSEASERRGKERFRGWRLESNPPQSSSSLWRKTEGRPLPPIQNLPFPLAWCLGVFQINRWRIQRGFPADLCGTSFGG